MSYESFKKQQDIIIIINGQGSDEGATKRGKKERGRQKKK